MIDDIAYGEALDYLTRYGADDWLMLSVVVSEAQDVLDPPGTGSDVLEVTMQLAASLAERRIVPGDLVGDDRDFVPWPDSPETPLNRLRRELTTMIERGDLPAGADICWFHRIVG